MQVEIPKILANFHLSFRKTPNNLIWHFPPLAALQSRITASIHQLQSVFDELVHNGPVNSVANEKGVGLNMDEFHHAHQGHDGTDRRENPAKNHQN